MRSVVIVGGGPAGLTAARVLHAGGLRDVLVLDRNQDAGGLPRICGHPGFGLLDLGRLLTGPAYARRLVERAQGAEIATGATVLGLAPGGVLTVSTASGVQRIESSAVLLATGIRESPRSARLVSGTRPWGVTTTGALQDMVYLGAMRPFARPVIVGTELVSFSALFTCRHAGIRPVAMLEESARITARRPADLLARGVFGVPILTNTRLREITGVEYVESVIVERAGRTKAIACDGIIFSGRFTPEASLVRASHIGVDPLTGGPSIDTFWRCTDPHFFAAGNILRPVEHSGAAAAEGRRAAEAILRALNGRLPDPAAAVPVAAAGALRYIYPQRVIATEQDVTLIGRAARAHEGWFRLLADGQEIARRRVSALPERRLILRVPAARLRGRTGLVATLD